jgi:tetratricopeptide (TPR) repeat protein
MMIRFLMIVISILGLSLNLMSQEEVARDHVRIGNDLYAEENLEDAEIKYRKAIEARSDFYSARYNLANVEYRKGNFEQAQSLYGELSMIVEDSIEKAELFYNMGNCLLEQEDFKKAYEMFKQSLKLNPKDKDAKYNLLHARSKLEEQEGGDRNQQNQDGGDGQQQQQQEQQGEGNEQNQGDQNQDKQGDQNKGEQNQDGQDKEGNQDQNSQNDQATPRPKDGKPRMSKDAADRQMARMAEKDKMAKQKADSRNAIGGRNKKDKDW